MTSTLTRTLLFQVLLLVALATAVNARTSRPKCRIELSRVVSRKIYYYVLCKCAASNDVLKSYVLRLAPPRKQDTQGRAEATLQCIQSRQTHLVRFCAHLNTTEFPKVVGPILNHCLQVKLSDDQISQNGPVTFDTQTCRSKVGIYFATTSAVIAWVCECNQGGFYEVVPGWPQYTLKGSGAALRADVAFMRECMLEDAEERMQNVCSQSPSDYYIQGLQSMETCCKRLQVNSDKKFACHAILPSNLGTYKNK